MRETRRVPRCAPLTPQGHGSGDVEAASSLTVNLARRHSVTTAALLAGVISVIEIAGRAAPAFSRRMQLHSADAYGQYAEALTQRLSVTMSVEHLEGITCLPWKDMLNPMGHALLHRTRGWCNECLVEDISRNRVPYGRLYWGLRPTTHCVHHKTRLIRVCPHCKSTQPYFPALPFLSHCDDCGESLLTTTNQPESEEAFEYWKSLYTFELVDRTQRSSARITHDDFRGWINSVCNRYRDAGQGRHLASGVQIDHSNLRRWQSGEAKPSLDMLIHFCVSVRCSPASIITKQHSMIDGQLLRTDKREKLSKRSRRSKGDFERIRKHLERVIARKTVPAPSLKQVARDLGCKTPYLNYRFPKLAIKIRDRAEECRNFRLKQARKRQNDQLQMAIEALSSRGLYPSTRHIRQVSGMSAMVLSVQEHRATIAKARKKYLDVDARASRPAIKRRVA